MSVHTGLNNDTLKRRNRGLVLKLIVTGECTSRVEIAKRTGLSKMSVSNIISEYVEKGVLQEHIKVAVRGQGRNPVSLCLAPTAPRIVGLHVFRSECVATLCDLKLQVLREYHFKVDANCAEQFPEALCHAVDMVMPEKGERVLGIGIGSIGPVDLKTGTILNPPNFYNIHDLPVKKLLAEHCDLPVSLDSQYNCAALAEKYFGVGREYQDFLFVGISNGIGSGMIANGDVFRNRSGLTSEIGHVSIDWHGNLCACGSRGCLETYAGTRVVEAKLARATGKDLDFAGFCRLAEREETSEAWPVLYEMVETLACALTSSINLFNPQAVIVGHDGGCALPEKCLKQLEARINEQKLVQEEPGIRVLKTGFGPSAQFRSCASTILRHVFDGDFV